MFQTINQIWSHYQNQDLRCSLIWFQNVPVMQTIINYPHPHLTPRDHPSTCRRRGDAQQPHAARQAPVRDFEARLGLRRKRRQAARDGVETKEKLGMSLDVTSKKMVTQDLTREHWECGGKLGFPAKKTENWEVNQQK